MFSKFFKIKTVCQHIRVNAIDEEAYCPDCGKLVQNKWFIVRCNCCNIKRQAHLKYDDILPDEKFCHNCGSEKYYIQELEKLNYTDIRYAVLKKTVKHKPKDITYNQLWVEESISNKK